MWIIWPCTTQQLERYLKKHFTGDHSINPSSAANCIHISRKESIVELIALREWSLTPESIAHLAHECFHAAEFILAGKVEHGDATSEVFAYLTDSIMRRCLRILAGKKQINGEWK